MKNIKCGLLVFSAVVLLFSGCGKIEPEAPGDFEYKYSEETHSVKFTWDDVSDVIGYQIDYGIGNGAQNVGNKTESVLKEPMDGDTFTARIRSVYKDDDEYIYSEWVDLKYTVPIYLGVPSNITYQVNGRKLEVTWDEAKGATGYEVTTALDKEGVVLTKCFAQKTIQAGEEGTTYIRAVRTTESGTYYSDWITANYTIPVIDYAEVSAKEAFFLDYNRLLDWADYNEMSYKVSEKTMDDTVYMVVDVYYEDSLNSGFFNTAGRVIDSAAESFWNSYVEETESSYSDDFATIEDTIITFIDNDSVQEYVDKVDESATQHGALSAIGDGLGALFLDTNIHYLFYYENYDNAARCCCGKLLKNNRENYDVNFRELKTDAEGFYDQYSGDFEQAYKFKMEVMNINGYDYWVVFSGK